MCNCGYRIWESEMELLVRFLKNLPLFIERPPYIFVHAGIRTGIPLHEQHEEDLLTIREPFFSENIQEDATIIFGHTPTHRLDVPVGMLWEKAKKLALIQELV